MEPNIPIDDQPISATFFNESHWMTDFVTPHAPDIMLLHRDLVTGYTNIKDKVVACWNWVANQIKYVPYVKANISIEGKSYYQEDFWQTPSMVSKTRIGNCANKAFLLTSLLRNEMPAGDVHVVLGNLHNGHVSGHAWVEARIHGTDYIIEATRNDVALVEADRAKRYEPIHYFNDQTVTAVPGRTIMVPFSACYSNWLRDYLSWGYINEEHNHGQR